MNGSENRTASCPAKPSTKRRSCDPCFKIKEKCTWSRNDEGGCDRCRRISKKCTNTRPTQRLGRKPKYAVQPIAAPVSSVPPSLSPFNAKFQDLSPYEEAMVSRLVDADFFIELMTVPRIGKAMHQQAMYSLLNHWDQTRDGCFSSFAAFASTKSMEIPGYDYEENLRRGTRALSTFRTMECPAAPGDVIPWLWLGMSVLIYAHCGLGNSGTAVRRYILHHLVQLGQQGKHLASHSTAVSLIALDIHESLIFRRMPVMNLPDSDDVGADTFLGLCAPLVRLSYDLARLSYRWGEGFVDEEVLIEFEKSAEAWQPDFPSNWSADLSSIEAAHGLTQVRVHKTMLLLFGHRLRFPFGREDVAGSRMAHSILSELDLATSATGQPPMWTMTPFLVAALEITSPDERLNVIRNIPIYGDKVSLKSQHLAAEFLNGFWAYRDHNSGFRWIDKMDDFPTLCLYA